MRSSCNYEEKSRQSLRDAEILIKSQGYGSGANRLFYSCLQKIYHVLFTKLNYGKDRFVLDTKYNKIGSHLQASILIGIELKKKNDDDYYWFKEQFNKLKKMREKADYSDGCIGQEEVNQALRDTESIITLLRKI